jgi:hypothetical protein
MPGGLLNLMTSKDDNVILNGNPQKTFFKNVYLKYTNFGLQKFRIDYKGLRSLRMNEPSYFNFKIPRHGDLLMDTYVVINLPDIWSPVEGIDNDDPREYKFQWIRNIGTEMIEEIEITSNGQTLQKFSGTYINLLSNRDFTSKKNNFDSMTGNTPDLYDPSYYYGGVYPNAIFNPNNPTVSAQPSINGKTLYVPIPAWFTLNSQQALPLVCLQYCEIHINIKFRAVRELFTICDVMDSSMNRIQPNFNESKHQFYRFIQAPEDLSNNYLNKSTDWNADIHLIANYAFLSQEENRVFTSQPQTYLIKDIYEQKFYDIAENNKINTMSSSMVISWMFGLRRSDVKLRNEWTNFTNFDYSDINYPILNDSLYAYGKTVGINNEPLANSRSGVLYFTGDSNIKNNKEILKTAGILIDGKYRENVLDAGIFKYTSLFSQSQGNFNSIPFIYNYNFCLNTSPYVIQPSGAINFNNYKNIELEITTNKPPINENSSYDVICDEDGNIIGINKPANSIYEYTYDLLLFEERYNVLTIMNGICGLKYAR